ncbi:type II toxin-antitoxin system VapC family toxin [Tomitella fengzijianii]|uniref:Type II toxin-antitoxin system VapC family toxin n=1 Tax=Tomitella fengzijianii TaxID=2597660 RepID=A0A516X231_9ACTN|nr:type II toxin-antitoxin system VapC family toxin [Tomitella fengzijianii]QDQ97145.1 type II toxin-antitoxin system VapC family toxin [Tomitella fengzijianii]
MTSILLDTNALLWLAAAPDRLGPVAHAVLSDCRHEVFVSAVSGWEISIRTASGRLNGDRLLASWAETMSAMGIDDIAVEWADGAMAGRLPWEHRDPFDRMIVAQAARRGWTIATSDRVMHAGALAPMLDTRI